MSHIRTDKTSIKEPDVDLLKQVAQHIAGTEVGGRIAARAKDYYAHNEGPLSDIGVSIFTQNITRGFAVNAMNKGKDGQRVLEFEGDGYLYQPEYDRVKSRVSGEYLDAMLARGFQQAQFAVTSSTPDTRGGRVLVFLGPGSTKVIVQRDADGRLEWNFEGFAGQECYDVQKVVADFLKANGVETETVSVTDKRDERWLEERLPGREMEREN